LQQGLFAVVAGYPVRPEKAAFGAAVYQHPFATPAPDGYRFHGSPAARTAVADGEVHMAAVEASGAMVALSCTGRFPGNGKSAMDAQEIFFEDKASCFAGSS
jgi:hypothetical protein